ncbi:MAG: hypothetical protein AAFO96_19665 [Bacteroidota bacterium]
MKYLISTTVLALTFFLIPVDTFALKIRIKGSGGVVVSGEDYELCPEDGHETCATIEGSFWDLLSAWWSSRASDPSQCSELGYVESESRKLSSPISCTIIDMQSGKRYSGAIYDYNEHSELSLIDCENFETSANSLSIRTN